MPVNPADTALIRSSFDRLRPDIGRHSTYFYDALFRHAPELRALFRDDLSGQGMRFMTTLDAILQHLDREEALTARYAELGHLHSSLGVVPAHFAPMEEALIDTLRHALGKSFTEEMDAAWRRVFKTIAAAMISRGDMA